MDLISAVKKCEEIVQIILVKEKKRYNELLLKLNETDINIDNLETKSEILEEENKILIDMVREERQNVHLMKEELRRSQKVEQEKDVSRIRAELEARIGDERVRRVEDLGNTMTRTMSSSPDDESNDDTLTENIDGEEQKEMNQLLDDDDDDEHLSNEETETLYEGQNILLDESIHIISDISSLEQNLLNREKCNECHNFYGNQQEVCNHIDKIHTKAHVSNEQKEPFGDNIDGISVNESSCLYDNLHEEIDKLLNGPLCDETEAIKNKDYLSADHVDVQSKYKEQEQGVMKNNEISKKNEEKNTKNRFNNTIFNSFDSVDKLKSEPEETNNIEAVTEAKKDKKEIAKQNVSLIKTSKRAREHTLKTTRIDSGEPVRKTRKRTQCGSCEGCWRTDCDECKACMDKPRNRGKGKMKKKCDRRNCTFLE